MKKSIILLSLIAVSISAIAQDNSKFSFELGKISSYELTMTEYEADKNADALVIFESGNFYFYRTPRAKDFYYSLIKTYKIKIKILKPSGIERAKFAIPIFNESEYVWEKFYVQTANVYNYNSTTKQIEQSVFKEEEALIEKKKSVEKKLNNNYIIKQFTLPDVKVGSIIELEYVIETPFVFAFEWQFQKNIPVVCSKFRFRTIPELTYTFQLNNDKKFDEYNEEILHSISSIKKEKAFNFTINNISAFNKEQKSNVLSLDFQLNEQRKTDYQHKIDRAVYEIVKNWKEYCNEILDYDDFGKYIKKTEKEAKKILPTLNLSGKNRQETMESILNYVKSNYNWNGLYGKYVLHQLPDFLQYKNGNAANINLFLIGMLNAAKISATPVLISQYTPNDVGKLHPFDAIFNYVIAAVTIGNTTYYIDAADFEKKSNIMGFFVEKKMNLFIEINKIEPNTIQNLKPEQEKYDSDGEFTMLLNRIKKVFYFE